MFSIPARSRLSIVVLATLTALALAFAVTQGWASTKSHKRTTHHRSNTLRASASAASEFSVLDRSPLAQDLDNAVLEGAASHDAQLLVSQARVLSRDGDATTWLIPAAGGKLCLALEPGERYTATENARGAAHSLLPYVCNTTARVLARGMALRTYGDIAGLVPDGVTSVVATVDGETAALPVSDNLFHAHTQATGFQHGSTASYEVPGSGATVTQQLP